MKTKLKQLIREILLELNEENTSASVGAYSTPHAFSKNKRKSNRPTNYIKDLGWTRLERPKRPSSTKLVDYLNEDTTRKI